MSEEGFFPMPPEGFTCFHCGENFKTPGAAKMHFGFDPSADPACRIKLGAERGLVSIIRKLEDEVARLTFELHNDGADACKSYRAALGRHHAQLQAVEELGYERGLHDRLRPMTDAPRDGTRILLKHWPKHYQSSRFGSGSWMRTINPKWLEVHWVSNKERTGSDPHWEEWTGDPHCSSSNHIRDEDAIEWMTVPASRS